MNIFEHFTTYDINYFTFRYQEFDMKFDFAISRLLCPFHFLRLIRTNQGKTTPDFNCSILGYLLK